MPEFNAVVQLMATFCCGIGNANPDFGQELEGQGSLGIAREDSILGRGAEAKSCCSAGMLKLAQVGQELKLLRFRLAILEDCVAALSAEQKVPH